MDRPDGSQRLRSLIASYTRNQLALCIDELGLRGFTLNGDSFRWVQDTNIGILSVKDTAYVCTLTDEALSASPTQGTKVGDVRDAINLFGSGDISQLGMKSFDIGISNQAADPQVTELSGIEVCLVKLLLFLMNSQCKTKVPGYGLFKTKVPSFGLRGDDVLALQV